MVAIGVNKSADVLIVADEDELKKRADAGELARKDTTLGVGYRAPLAAAVPRPRPPVPARRPAGRPWTAQQEKIVRLYHEMGLRPAEIVERARKNTPRLGITSRLVTQILSARPTR
jgi:hypothetical protein